MRILRVLLASIVSTGLVAAVAVAPASVAEKPITVRVYHEVVNPITVSGTGIGIIFLHK